jgi:hypothetical protein
MCLLVAKSDPTLAFFLHQSFNQEHHHALPRLRARLCELLELNTLRLPPLVFVIPKSQLFSPRTLAQGAAPQAPVSNIST